MNPGTVKNLLEDMRLEAESDAREAEEHVALARRLEARGTSTRRWMEVIKRLHTTDEGWNDKARETGDLETPDE